MEFRFPDLGEGITKGELVKWLVKEGDSIKVDQAIAEVETDKAVVEIPSPVKGKITKLFFKQGEEITVGDILVDIETQNKDAMDTIKKEEVKKAEQVKKEEEDKVLASPFIRKLAKELNIDLNKVKATGKGNTITEQDLIKASKKANEKQNEKQRPKQSEKQGEQTNQKPSKRAVITFEKYGRVLKIPLKGTRKKIAENLKISWTTIPQVTSMDEIDVTELFELREKEKEIQKKKGIKLTFLPFIIKAVVAALKEHPYLNSSLDQINEEIVIKQYYNIGFALDTSYGLLVPVIKNVEEKSILEIAKDIVKLSSQARDRTISLQDLKGGTFTVTNYGSIGGTFGTPIINYPEAAVLGIGRIYDKAIKIDKEITTRKVLPVSLTFDHRILDGAEAARFLNYIKKHLKDPKLLMMDMI